MSDTVDFGAQLREARERHGLTLQQISASTKISSGILEALERNAVSRLPGGIFTRAFVRAYAAQVGLDPEQTLREFLLRFPQEATVEGTPLPDEAAQREAIEGERRRVRIAIQVVGLSAVVAMATIYFGLSDRGATPGRAGREPEPARATAASPADASAADPAPSDAATRAGMAGQQPVGTVLATLVIVVAPQGACWISVRQDGEAGIARLLQPGDRTVVRVRDEILLTLGDAGAVEVTINGRRARPLGGRGEVVTVRINARNYRSYLPSSPGESGSL